MSEAFQIMLARIGPLLAVSIIGYVALFALSGGVMVTMLPQLMGTMGGGEPTSPDALLAGAGFGLILLYIVIYAISFAQQAALCRICSGRHDASISGAISAGIKCVPTLFGAAILLLIALVVVGLVIGLGMAGVVAGTESPGLSVLLALALMIGCIYIFVRLSMVLPVVAVDDVRNPITAIGNAWRMTGGNVLRLVLVFVLVSVVMGVLFMVLSALTLGSFNPGAVPSMGNLVGFGALMLVLGLTVGLYFLALVAAIHRQLSETSVGAVEDTFA
ncbi:hypothetical protein [Novosphingobium sp.]|uniref:hypothetical protein n=1 Tax=Novosphingobium sp. TaxID=1874826 RepID=UPI002736A1A0|nr:hypothetical protein [Novosphingobium sp.]MDP3907717.1 hypothetical protein [Novosphingobium sp.]